MLKQAILVSGLIQIDTEVFPTSSINNDINHLLLSTINNYSFFKYSKATLRA